MKKYLLLFGLIAMAACSSRDDKSCHCYEQRFERVKRINPQKQTVSDTGWQSVGGEKEYSNNCSDNDKMASSGSSTVGDGTGWETITTVQFRYKCYNSKK